MKISIYLYSVISFNMMCYLIFLIDINYNIYNKNTTIGQTNTTGALLLYSRVTDHVYRIHISACLAGIHVWRLLRYGKQQTVQECPGHLIILVFRCRRNRKIYGDRGKCSCRIRR